MSFATGLSSHDNSVLVAIFGGEEGAINYSSNNDKIQNKVIVDVDLPPDLHVSHIEDLVELEKSAIRQIELKNNLDSALEIFNGIIQNEPLYASAYNNRAQVLRMKLLEGDKTKREAEHSSSSDKSRLYAAIITDLERAIDLASPASNDTQLRVSKMQGTILKSAYAQLGATYVAMSEDHDYLAQHAATKKWDLEELASTAFYKAGDFGEELAKALSARINPYAKLCGNIVQEALMREREGY